MNSRALRVTCGENTGLMLPQDEATAKEPAPRLLVDAMLGRLVRWLRLMGYDAAYWRDGSDEALIAAAQAEDRLIVTRDHALAGRRGVRALLIAAEGLDEQIAEARTALGGAPAPFTRCSACGGELTDLPRAPRAILCRPMCGRVKRSSAVAHSAAGSTGEVRTGPRCRGAWRRTNHDREFRCTF